MSQVTMKGMIAIVGSGIIGNVAREFLCREHPEITIVESVEDIPKETVFPVKNFEIEPLIISERYAFDSDFRKKKKPKNAEWQNRMKQLMRR